MSTIFSDNFDSDTTGSIAPGWTAKVGTWQVGTTRPVSSPNTFGSTTAGDGDVALLTGQTAIADMSVFFDQVLAPVVGSYSPAVGAVLRCDSAYSNCYALLLQFNSSNVPNITLFKRVSGSYSQVASQQVTGLTFTVGQAYSFRAQVQGTAIKGKVWPNSSSEPASFQLSVTDSSVTAAGYCGLYNGENGNSGSAVAIDDFVLSDFNSGAATAISVSGPTSGTVNTASSNFTVSVNGSLASAVVVTPSDGGAGGTFTPSTVTLAAGSTPTGTFTYTPSSTGTKTISYTNNGSLTNPASSSYASNSASGNTLLPNNAAIVYSPGNWDITSARALTINSGAYFSTFFSGSSISLAFDISSMGSPASEIYYRIDGYEAQTPWTKAVVAATITPTMPSDTAAFPYHLLEVVVKSTSETINRWNTGTGTAVKLTGITLATSAVAIAPGVAPGGEVDFYGDSITEGVRTVNSTATNDTDRNDVMMGWAYAMRRLLGVEVGINGFGATGLVVSGSGNVPALPSSYQFIMSGIARNKNRPNLKLIVLNEGTNDSSQSASAVTTALTTVLNGLISTYPGVPIAVMRPFNGSQAAALQAGIAACSSPTSVTYIDTTGFLVNAYGIDALNLHPSGPNDQAIVAPQVAAALRLLANGTGRTSANARLPVAR